MVKRILGAVGIIAVIVVISIWCGSQAEQEATMRETARVERLATLEVEHTRSAQIPPTDAPEPTDTPSPTTPTTATSIPTDTPIPTATPTRVPPTPVPAFPELKAKARHGIPYDDLYRYNEEYLDNLVYYRGEVHFADESETREFWNPQTQQIESVIPDHDYILTVAITYNSPTQYTSGWWEDGIALLYNGPRILPMDIIEFVGTVEPLEVEWYQGPIIRAIRTQIVTKAGDRQ